MREIQEVKNAIKTYELYPTLDAFKEADLLKAHGIMMQALVDNAGHYRGGGVGVFGNQGLVHLAPPATRVPSLMSDLFNWLRNSQNSKRPPRKIKNYTENAKIMESNPSVTIDYLCEACGLTRDGINWNIRKLKEQGKIRRIGPDKGGYWEVIQ